MVRWTGHRSTVAAEGPIERAASAGEGGIDWPSIIS